MTHPGRSDVDSIVESAHCPEEHIESPCPSTHSLKQSSFEAHSSNEESLPSLLLQQKPLAALGGSPAAGSIKVALLQLQFQDSLQRATIVDGSMIRMKASHTL